MILLFMLYSVSLHQYISQVHFRVLLDPYTVEEIKANYDFSTKTNSTNPEDTSTVSDNDQNFSVEVKADISLLGWAQYPDIHYYKDTYKSENYTSETEIGPQIVHTYGVKNNGPSNINEADVLLMWPSQTLEGDDLLYLMEQMEQPELQGKISCEFVSDVNPLKMLSKKYNLDASTSESSKLSGQGGVTSEERQSFSGSTESRHDDISDIIQCRSAKCSVIKCKSGRLVKDEEAFAVLRFRANAATLKKIAWNKGVTVSSMMVSRINKLPHIGIPLHRPIHTHEVFTNLTLMETEIKPNV